MVREGNVNNFWFMKGKQHPMLGRKLSKKRIEEMREVTKTYMNNPKVKKRCSERLKNEYRLGLRKINPNFTHKNHLHTKETKEKISQSKKLNPYYPTKEHRDKMSKASKNRIHPSFKHSKLAKLNIKLNNSKYWLGKNHSLETIKKIREARAIQVFPMIDSKIEVKIQNFLEKMGIEYFTHKHIKEIEHSYQCDILIPSMNLIIECDGDYWHKYPIGKEIDHIRTKELLEKGFKVLRLWECEIKKLRINSFRKILERKW